MLESSILPSIIAVTLALSVVGNLTSSPHDVMNIFSSSKPLPYTSDPFHLLLSEIWLFVRCSTPNFHGYYGLLSIIWPLWPWRSGALDELYPFSLGNLWADLWHFILFVLQVGFIIFVPLSAFTGLPIPPLLATPAFILSFIGFILVNQLVCTIFLDGPPARIFISAGPHDSYSAHPDDPDHFKRLISAKAAHKGERWVFINGVAVGSHWLDSNLKRLVATFRRPILGIHNATYGIPFDVLECMIQRTFCFPTLDIRTAYTTISSLLSDKSVTKLVLIAHSQGSIEAGMVLDWLYSTLSTAEVSKLEVYTFGNASNHWNNPISEDGLPVIKHIEHYANEYDWVSRFGILHFRPLSIKARAEGEHTTALRKAATSPITTKTKTVVNGADGSPAQGIKKALSNPTISTTIQATAGPARSSTASLEAALAAPHRFAGRLFLRHASGHQFNQHYLDNIFPMSYDSDGRLDEVNDHVASFISLPVDEAALASDNVVKPYPGRGSNGSGRKIKDLSYLWKYVNGKVPDDEVHGQPRWAGRVAGRKEVTLQSPMEYVTG